MTITNGETSGMFGRGHEWIVANPTAAMLTYAAELDEEPSNSVSGYVGKDGHVELVARGSWIRKVSGEVERIEALGRPPMATERQRSYLADLLARHDEHPLIGDAIEKPTDLRKLTKSQASTMIEMCLQDLRRGIE